MNDDKNKETNKAIEQLSGFFTKIAAIYHGVDPSELNSHESQGEAPIPASSDVELQDLSFGEENAPAEIPTPAEPVVPATPAEIPVPAEPNVPAAPAEIPTPAEPVVPATPAEIPVPAEPDVPATPAEIPAPAEPDVPATPVEIPIPAESDDDTEAKRSRRQERKAREEEDLFLSEDEARRQIRRQLQKRQAVNTVDPLQIPSVESPHTSEVADSASLNTRDTRDTAREAVRRQLDRKQALTPIPRKRSSKRLIITIGAIVLTVAILALAVNILSRLTQAEEGIIELQIQEPIANLDYLSANLIYMTVVAEDPDYHTEALAAINRKKDTILRDYRSGLSTYDQAYDQLSALAMFMPLWSEELRSYENALMVPAVSSAIKAEEILAESFNSIKNYKDQERNFRLGQQLLNMDLNAVAIPYLRLATEAGGELGQTAAEQLRRSESTFLVNVVSNAQNYIASGDALRARLTLETANEIIPENTEIETLLAGLPPLDYSELRLDISAMAMTYFNGERYHESLLIVQTGRTYLGDLINAIEEGVDLSLYSGLTQLSVSGFVTVESNEELWRTELAKSLQADIESLNALEEELRQRIVNAIRADATQKADEGKYREARDLIAFALEFTPSDQSLKEKMNEYNNLTKLRLNSFMNDSTAFGFGLEEMIQVRDIQDQVHENVAKLVSSTYAPALRLRSLPYKYNRFQGVFYLADLAEAANVQIVIRQGNKELYRSEPMNERSPEQSFDISYDFTQALDIQILGSTRSSATRYAAQAAIEVILDGYFYNDGNWDEEAAVELNKQHQEAKQEANTALADNIAKAEATTLYDEIMDDSLIYELFGKDNLLDSASSSSGDRLERVVSLKGRETQAVKTTADHLRGEVYLADAASATNGIVLMVEDGNGQRWFSPVISDRQQSIKIDIPVEGNFTLSLLNGSGERITQNRYQILIDATVYDFDRMGGESTNADD